MGKSNAREGGRGDFGLSHHLNDASNMKGMTYGLSLAVNMEAKTYVDIRYSSVSIINMR